MILNRKFFAGSGLTAAERKRSPRSLGFTMMNNTTNMVNRLVQKVSRLTSEPTSMLSNPTSTRLSHLTPLVLRFGRLPLRAMPLETLAITVTQLQAMRLP